MLTASSHSRLDLVGVRDVDRGERATNLRGQRLASLGLQVSDNDVGTLAGELAGDGRADARSRPGNDG